MMNAWLINQATRLHICDAKVANNIPEVRYIVCIAWATQMSNLLKCSNIAFNIAVHGSSSCSIAHFLTKSHTSS